MGTSGRKTRQMSMLRSRHRAQTLSLLPWVILYRSDGWRRTCARPALGWVLLWVPCSISRAEMLTGLQPGCAPHVSSGFIDLFRSQDDYVDATWLATRYLSFEFLANESPVREGIRLSSHCSNVQRRKRPASLVTTLEHCGCA